MRKFLIALVALLSLGATDMHGAGNATDSLRSRRASLCSIMVKHTSDQYANEIEGQFREIPIDDKYNDHNLSVRVAAFNSGKVTEETVRAFVEENQIASRLVARWFNRNKLTGECDLNLVKSRGLYDASALDHELASHSVLGKAMLEDAGEELIGHTYLLVHDITYIDKGKRSSFWGSLAEAAISVGAAYAGVDVSLAKDLGKLGNATISSLKGFRVKIHSHLYRLVWDDESSSLFYTTHYWQPGASSDPMAFEKGRGSYRLEYVGDVTSKGGTTSFLGINEEEPYLMIRKACARAIEENVADLQKKYEQFRIKTPVTSVSPTITARIGLKEGVTPKSRFAVLERREKNGKTEYHQVGVVEPIFNMIWDNRFMATEEGAYGADFGCTTFKKVSGGDFYPGMLLREL